MVCTKQRRCKSTKDEGNCKDYYISNIGVSTLEVLVRKYSGLGRVCFILGEIEMLLCKQ